jgi:hypothetical protein
VPSILTDSPTSGYVLAQWAIQFAIENPESFWGFLTEASKIPPTAVTPDELTEDLEMAKSLLGALATMTDSLVSGGIGIRLMGIFPTEDDPIKTITDGINPTGQ